MPINVYIWYIRLFSFDNFLINKIHSQFDSKENPMIDHLLGYLIK